nr:retrovirus-related Pol polyprotein from transposon TNT 1-94 [Tanacetum cinerariifolium]
MEPYYIQCIKDCPFEPKMAEGADKPKSQWTPNERRVVNQDQCLKSIIISCLPDDIMQSVIICETSKDTWTDLDHNFKGPSDTKENGIMDLKLEYQTLPEKWLSFSYGLRNANHTQTLDLANIYGSHDELKVQKGYKAEYKKIKAKLTLLKASPPTYQSSKPSQTKNKGLVAETFDWDEEEVSDDDEETRVQVLIALDDYELSVRKNHTRNGEYIDVTMKKCRDDLLALKQAKLEAFSFQIHNTELIKLNRALREERKVNEKWLNSSNRVTQCISEQIPNQKKKILGGEQLTESSSKNDVKENHFVPASLDYDHESSQNPKIGLRDSILTANFQTLTLEEF